SNIRPGRGSECVSAVWPLMLLDPDSPPCHDPTNEMKRDRPVAAATTFIAVSLASDPECPNHTRRSPLPGVTRSRSSASATAFSFAYADRLAPPMLDTAALTTSTTAGWPVPSIGRPNRGPQN